MKLQRAATLMTLSMTLGQLGCVVSAGDEDPMRTDASTSPATGSDGSIAQADGGGGGAKPSGGGDAGTGASNPTGAKAPATTAESCAAALIEAPTACLLPDPLETLGKADVVLATDTRCAVAVAALTDDRDEDLYRFTAVKSDPVLVELSYATPKSAELTFRVRDSRDTFIAENTSARTGPKEDARAYFVANAGLDYDINVEGDKVNECQPYALRVDPYYCTDSYEDNDSLQTSSKLSWAADKTVAIAATSFPEDDDYYEFAPEKKDPVRLTGTYTVSDTSLTDLTWRVTGVADAFITEDTTRRTGLTENFDKWVFPQSAGGLLRLRVYADGDLCAPYQLKLEAAACTDAFEDNDTEATAAVLPAGSAQRATIIDGDDDVYKLSALPAGGLCTIEYSVPAGSAQKLSANLVSSTGSFLDQGDEMVNGDQRTLVVKWSGTAKPGTLKLEASETSCQSYTIQCVAQ